MSSFTIEATKIINALRVSTNKVPHRCIALLKRLELLTKQEIDKIEEVRNHEPEL